MTIRGFFLSGRLSLNKEQTKPHKDVTIDIKYDTVSQLARDSGRNTTYADVFAQ